MTINRNLSLLSPNVSTSGTVNNAGLTNSSVTIGSTSVSLGSTVTTFAGLSSVTSTTFVGSLTGNASTASSAASLTTPRNINGVAFDGSANITITANTTNALTIGTGLSGTSFDGSSAVTIAIDSTVATLTGSQTLTNKTLTNPTLTTPVLGTPTSGNFSTGTFTWPTFNQSTTGSAATLTTPRSIYGNNFDGSADLTGVITSTYGGTGNGFTKFSGAATAEKTYTLPDVSTTILTTNAAVTIAQGGTGQTSKTAAYDALSPTTTKGDIEVFDGTNNVRLAVGTNTYVLTADSTTATGVKWAASAGGGSALTVKDEGTNLSTAVTSIDFVGAGVAATNTGGDVIVTISGGGSGSSIANGTSDVSINTSGGNIAFSVGGTANVVTVDNLGLNFLDTTTQDTGMNLGRVTTTAQWWNLP